MPLYYKKVDASQLVITDEQKESIRKGGQHFFEVGKLKDMGGGQFGTIIKIGDTLHPIHETQWLVKHPEGNVQILWPHEFDAKFVAPKEPANVTI